MTAPGVWLLNLDAELEVEARARYRGPLVALSKRPELATALAALIPSGDRVLSSLPSRGELSGQRAFCWSPTPSASGALKLAGAAVVRPLPIEVLRCVMNRGFSAELGLHFEAASWLLDVEAALAKVRLPSPSGRWLARRAFGFAGKARRVFAELHSADEAFVTRAATEGGVLIEPFFECSLDVGLHGFVSAAGLVLGEPVINTVGGGGVFRSSRRAEATDLSADERAAILLEATRAASALTAAGYCGPFGIDGFRYELGGRAAFQPRSEINARYSMAWALGMGSRRPDLD